jgi:hypothetical protein
MNFYPLCKNEISLPFIKLNVAITPPPRNFIYFLYYLKMAKLAETCNK